MNNFRKQQGGSTSMKSHIIENMFRRSATKEGKGSKLQISSRTTYNGSRLGNYRFCGTKGHWE
jgi:hypothetical protein